MSFSSTRMQDLLSARGTCKAFYAQIWSHHHLSTLLSDLYIKCLIKYSDIVSSEYLNNPLPKSKSHHFHELLYSSAINGQILIT